MKRKKKFHSFIYLNHSTYIHSYNQRHLLAIKTEFTCSLVTQCHHHHCCCCFFLTRERKKNSFIYSYGFHYNNQESTEKKKFFWSLVWISFSFTQLYTRFWCIFNASSIHHTINVDEHLMMMMMMIDRSLVPGKKLVIKIKRIIVKTFH